MCIVLSSLQNKRQQINPSTGVGLRQNQDEEQDSEVLVNNDDSTNETTAPLVSYLISFLCVNGAVGKDETGKRIKK